MSYGEMLVDLHLPAKKTEVPVGPHVDDALLNWARADLMLALSARAADVVVTRGANAFDFEGGQVSVQKPAIEQGQDDWKVTVTPDVIDIESIRAIRNVSRVIGHGVPELNTPLVRDLAKDKCATNALLGIAGYPKDWARAGGDISVSDALEAMTADDVVIKPQRGSKSQGIQMGTKARINALFKLGAFDPEEEWVIEERFGFAPPITVEGMSADDQIRIDMANAEGSPKELRAFYFGENVDGPVLSWVMRSARAGDDRVGRNEWIFVDQESVPEDLRVQTKFVADHFGAAAETRELHLAVDWMHVENHAGQTLWLPGEINGAEPQLVWRSENPHVAADQADKLAAQLIRIAKQGGTAQEKI